MFTKRTEVNTYKIDRVWDIATELSVALERFQLKGELQGTRYCNGSKEKFPHRINKAATDNTSSMAGHLAIQISKKI